MERAVCNDTAVITALKSTLRDTQKTIDNIMNAIEQGIITDTTKQRLMEAEDRKKAVLISIANEEIKRPPISKDHIEFFLRDMRNKIYGAEDQAEVIIRTFVNAVYLYDDKLVLTFNFQEGEALKKLTLSEIEKFGFDSTRFTIAVLSELFMFAIIVKLRGR